MRILAIATTFLAVTAVRADDVTKELEKLNGVWAATSAQSGDNKISLDELRDFKLTIKDGTFIARRGMDERRGTIKIDPAKKPMTMDIVLDAGDKDKPQLAIYDLQTGVLKICTADPDKKDRPTDFDTRGKPGVTALVFRKSQ